MQQFCRRTQRKGLAIGAQRLDNLSAVAAFRPRQPEQQTEHQRKAGGDPEGDIGIDAEQHAGYRGA